MIRKFSHLYAVLFLFAFTLLAGVINAQVVTSSCTLENIDNYGAITLDISVADFQKAGFEYADMVKVEIAGKTIKMPVVSNYRCATSGSPMLVMPGNLKRMISFNAAYSDFAKQFGIINRIVYDDLSEKIVPAKGIKFPLDITISMDNKQGYKKEYEVYDLIRTYKRSDYKDLSDEEFCNFREVTTKNFAKNKLYRCSTPINKRIGRNLYADRICKEAKIKTFFNLCEARDAALSHPTYKTSYYATANVHYLPLNVDVTSKIFNNGIKSVAEGMLDPKAFPCLIHCVEGQDRTGFACAMLELFMGADMESVKADYVKTFMNYYGVKPNTHQYDVIANNIYLNLDRVFATYIKGYKGITKSNTQELAKLYFKSLGLTESQLNKLWDNLAK